MRLETTSWNVLERVQGGQGHFAGRRNSPAGAKVRCGRGRAGTWCRPLLGPGGLKGGEGEGGSGRVVRGRNGFITAKKGLAQLRKYTCRCKKSIWPISYSRRPGRRAVQPISCSLMVKDGAGGGKGGGAGSVASTRRLCTAL